MKKKLGPLTKKHHWHSGFLHLTSWEILTICSVEKKYYEFQTSVIYMCMSKTFKHYCNSKIRVFKFTKLWKRGYHHIDQAARRQQILWPICVHSFEVLTKVVGLFPARQCVFLNVLCLHFRWSPTAWLQSERGDFSTHPQCERFGDVVHSIAHTRVPISSPTDT